MPKQTSDADNVPRLSCELCRERKVRCDKASPHCTNCVKAGVTCVPVYRKRHARGRHAVRCKEAPQPTVEEGHGRGRRDTSITAQLCHVYNRQVDPIVKILHRPSLSAYMVESNGYLHYEPGHPSPAALRSAVCYAAVASMTEEQCQATFESSKPAVTLEYRNACDAALNKADLLTTTDITVLQAFVLYLVARRAGDPSRAVWTLIAVAVRIAKALSLDLEHPTTPGSFFTQQMRHRLWCTICVLDLQASFYQSSDPLVNLQVEYYTLPRNVNDQDFGPHFQGDLPDKTGLTDMTFSLVRYTAQLSGRLLNFHDRHSHGSANPGPATSWEGRQRLAARFEDQARSLTAACDPDSSPYAWFTFHGTQALAASMHLSALRPPSRAAGPRGAPPRADLLAAALGVLRRAHLVRTDPRGEGFRWYVNIQWHALAIAVAECCACADAGVLAAAWPVVERACEGVQLSAVGAGAVQLPLHALMLRARANVEGVLRAPGAVAGWLPDDRQQALQSAPPFTLGMAGAACPADPVSVPTSLGFGFGPTVAFAPSSLDTSSSSSSSLTVGAVRDTPGDGFGEPWSLAPSHPSSEPDSSFIPTNLQGGMDLDPLYDSSWQTWDELLSDLQSDGVFFDGNTGLY